MIVTCEACGKSYDDTPNWTICPHNPLDVKADAVYCRRHDLFDCYLCGQPIATLQQSKPMSETSICRERLKRFIQPDWLGADIGYGGDPITPRAICVDLHRPYTRVGDHPQTIAADCRVLPFLDGSLDYVYSSHLIEDFTYEQQVEIIFHWAKKIKMGGLIILYCPDQQVFLQHCNKTGQPINEAHKEADYSYGNFVQRVLLPANRRLMFPLCLHRIHGQEHVDTYSWEMVLEKSPSFRSEV